MKIMEAETTKQIYLDLQRIEVVHEELKQLMN